MLRVNVSGAIVGGIAGAAIMSILMALARAAGIPVALEPILGAAVTGRSGALAWALGLGLHLAVGGAFGAIYALLFRLSRRNGPWFGAMVGAWHAMVAGLLLGSLPAVHPAMPDAVPAPGAFFVAGGNRAVLVFFALHVVFGIVVGVASRRVIRARLGAAPEPARTQARTPVRHVV